MGKKPIRGRSKHASCKVCNHDHLIEIENALVIDKMASRDVEEMIIKNGWQSVTYVTLLKHKKEHIDTKRELVLRYLEEKRKLLEGQIAPDEDPEYDEQTIRLNELGKLDQSIQQANILMMQSSKVLQNQLSWNNEREPIQVDKKPGRGRPRKRPEIKADHSKNELKNGHVPVQRELITLYKAASEELRMTAKAKLEMLGVGADYKQADSMGTLVDIVMDVNERKTNKMIE